MKNEDYLRCKEEFEKSAGERLMEQSKPIENHPKLEAKDKGKRIGGEGWQP